MIIQSVDENKVTQILNQLTAENNANLEKKLQKIASLEQKLSNTQKELTNVKVELANCSKKDSDG